tara:strand:- start:15147 stop:17051 length:1905 start_codon:yes stop_codon:yes gene_type:complete
MPSTVYKGDVSEVLFAPETGMIIRQGTDVSISAANSSGVTTLTFSSESNNEIFENNLHKLKYPKNALVGSQVTFTGLGDATDRKIFTIIENDGTTLKISPAMAHSGAFSTGDTMEILPFKTPPMDIASVSRATNTDDPSESLFIDQFLGIANAIALPETKVDLKRFHVVGLGRDTSVQVPGKYITEGGSFEVNLHSARWLKYCLGNEVVGNTGTSGTTTTLAAKAHAGQSHVTLASSTNIEKGRYLLFKDTAGLDASPVVDIVTDHAATQGIWDGLITDRDFDKANGYEIRRVIGNSEPDHTLYLDQPLSYTHGSGSDVQVFEYDNSALASTNAPAIDPSTQQVTNSITHLLFGRSEVPSFCLEVSQRRRDENFSSSGAIGTGTDNKELTRIYRGCKVTDFTLTTDNDAALRLSVNFNSALTYTDVGRLEAPGTSTSRYNPHRMFDDTASNAVDRLKSGIGIGTQKPFMFYNGQITTAGITVAQVLSFSLTGSTGMQAFHTINNTHTSNDSAESAVPFAGSRNTSIMVEGQTSYEMTMEIVVDDPIFYHKMRAGTSFSVNSEGATTNQIVVEFEKQARGNTAVEQTEKIVILIDEYYIVEAPMQIPEDKGAMKSTLKIMPKSIKVLARDTILKY